MSGALTWINPSGRAAEVDFAQGSRRSCWPGKPNAALIVQAARRDAASCGRRSTQSLLQNSVSEVIFLGPGGVGAPWSGGGGPAVDDTDDLIDGEREDAT